MRSLYIIVGGLVLLGVFALVARYAGGTLGRAALYFIPVWFIVAAVNMGMGVAKGYSVREELPIFLMIFAVPAAVALFVWWRMPRA